MLSYNQIRQQAIRSGRRAAENSLEPRVLCSADLEDGNGVRHIPNLGTYIPLGWELVKTYFVDASGVGEPGELALTFNQFVEAIRPQVLSDETYGYAIIEAGQFQIYVGEFKRAS